MSEEAVAYSRGYAAGKLEAFPCWDANLEECHAKHAGTCREHFAEVMRAEGRAESAALTLALARFFVAYRDDVFEVEGMQEIATEAGLLVPAREGYFDPGDPFYVDTDLSRQALALVEAAK